MKSIVKLTNISFFFFLVLLISCKKPGITPIVETAPITDVSTFSALCGGTVTSEGSSPVIARGVCWAAKLNPTINDIKTQDGSGPGTFTSTIAGIYEGVAYFVRAYATNSAGTSYGNTKSFIAEGHTPAASVTPATNITSKTVTLNGLVNPNNLSTKIIFQYGPSIVYDSTIVAVPYEITDNINISVSADITGLKASTVYHYRIIATNSLGATFSSDINFRTLAK